jgi:hypothetical protein
MASNVLLHLLLLPGSPAPVLASLWVTWRLLLLPPSTQPRVTPALLLVTVE